MTWSAVAYIAYNSTTQCVFGINGTQRKRYEGPYGYEWGSDAPTFPPTLSAGTATGLTGNYNALYTYARKERDVVVFESNPGPAAIDAVTLTNDALSLVMNPPADEQINCIRVYRTTDDGATYYFSQDINYCNRDYSVTYLWEETEGWFEGPAYQFTVEDLTNGSYDTCSWEEYAPQFEFNDPQIRITSPADNIYYAAGAWSDNPKIEDTTTDALLSFIVASDHGRPPAGGPVFGPTNNGVLFICVGHKLYFCKPQQPEYWPENYYIDVSTPQSPLIGGCFWNQNPYVFDSKTAYLISGSGNLVPIWQGDAISFYRLDYTPYNLSAQTGAQSSSGILAVEGQGIFHTGLDGVYILTPGSTAIVSRDQPVTLQVSRLFKDTINGMDAVGDVSKSWLLWYDNSLYFGYPGKSDTYPTNILVYNTNTTRWVYQKYPVEFSYAITDRFNNRVLAVTVDGQLWVLEDPDATTDMGSVIPWEVETKEFILQTRRHFPRWSKYDVDASEAVLATGYNIVAGSILQTHTLTGNRRDTRRRMISLGNGPRFSMRVSGEGTASIYAIESE